MGSTTIYLDDETLEIIKTKKKSNPDFNLSKVVQEIVKEDNKESLTEEGLLREINSRKSEVYRLNSEIEVLEVRLHKLRQKLEYERINRINDKERQEELRQINEFVDNMTIAQHEERKKLKLSVMDYAKRRLKDVKE